MATTEHVTAGYAPAGDHRGRRRSLWTAATLAAGLVLGVGALAVARGGDDASPSLTFWGPITAVGPEVSPPQTVDDIAKAADAVVVAHVTGIRDGREDKGYFDPTPSVKGSVPAPRTTFVELAVTRVVAGSVSSGTTLDLEMLSPPEPITLDDLRAVMPSDDLLVFLDNSGKRARAAGYGALVGSEEDSIWRLASQRGVVAQGSMGLYDALDPNEGDQGFLRSFGTTLDDAVARTQAALG